MYANWRWLRPSLVIEPLVLNTHRDLRCVHVACKKIHWTVCQGLIPLMQSWRWSQSPENSLIAAEKAYWKDSDTHVRAISHLFPFHECSGRNFSNLLNALSLGTRRRTHARSHTNHTPPTRSAVWFEVLPGGSQLPTECVTGLSTGLCGAADPVSRHVVLLFFLSLFVLLLLPGLPGAFWSLAWLPQPHGHRARVCLRAVHGYMRLGGSDSNN